MLYLYTKVKDKSNLVLDVEEEFVKQLNIKGNVFLMMIYRIG